MAYEYYTNSNLQFGIEINSTGSHTVTNEDSLPNASALSLGDVGDILTGTVLQIGDSPIVEMNGTPIQVRSTALQDTKPGDKIYLQITQNTSSEITMKLVDQKTISSVSRNGSMQTEILKNTAKFAENWKQTMEDLSPEYKEWSQDANYLLQNMTDEEKAKLRQMGIDVSSSNLTFVKSLLSQLRGKEQDDQLQDAINSVRKQILLEQGNELDISDITKEANACLPISEEQTVYLIQNELPLSIENLYKSEYSAPSMPGRQPLSDRTFQQMQPQIERAIQTAGMQVDESTMNTARFLLNHQLPVNTDSLKTYTAIQDINAAGFQETQIAKQLTENSFDLQSSSADYRQIDLYFPSPAATVRQIKEDFRQITEEGFWAFTETGLPYTLDNLSTYCQSAAPSDTNSNLEKNPKETAATIDPAALTAHRQLEELRLKMTWEASYTLAAKDIHICARELTQVVEALRNQERDYYKQQFQSDGMTPTSDDLKLLEDTNHKVQNLPYLPAAALGTTVFSGTFTIERLYTNGVDTLSKWSTTISYTKISSYETLMTRPRSDMGDSIQKAFRNTNDLLEEMNLPITEENQRAVRILGYNQMEISPEHLEQVKAADAQVQTLIQNLQPSVVYHLVRDGVNPLQMPIEELNALIQDYINEEGITDEAKYSEFLQKLDRRKAITTEERKGYIGIYRLLDKITKSKGKDIGTLVRNGQSITLQNLLTAHRSNRAAGMDTTIDESFGGLEQTGMQNSISQQVEEGFTISYNQQLTEQLFHRITPELIDQMTEEAAQGATLEEFFDTIQKQLTDEIELQNLQQQNLNGFDETTYQFMKTMDIFPSITNMITASEIVRGDNRTFRRIADNAAEDLNQLSEHLNSPEEMEEAYAQLETTVTEAVHQKDTTGTITAKDIQALKQIRSGLRILQKMSRKEQFQIPFSINGEWNIINLSLIQNSDTKGLLQADVPTEYGTISTTVSWKQNHWEGTVSADSPEGNSLLAKRMEQISDGLEQITASIWETDANSAPTTDEMYRMAKQLVLLLKHVGKE